MGIRSLSRCGPQGSGPQVYCELGLRNAACDDEIGADRGIHMANITAQMVKELRERTGAGMMDCKSALQETAGAMEQAVDLLRKRGLAKAAKKAGRIAAEGLIGVAVEHSKGGAVEG